MQIINLEDDRYVSEHFEDGEYFNLERKSQVSYLLSLSDSNGRPVPIYIFSSHHLSKACERDIITEFAYWLLLGWLAPYRYNSTDKFFMTYNKTRNFLQLQLYQTFHAQL